MNGDIHKRLGIIGIHVAILSVLVGIIVAYVGYYSGMLDDVELSVIKEAEKN